MSNSTRRGPLGYLYGVYAVVAFIACLAPALAGVAVMPGLERRRRWASTWASVAFFVCGISVRLRGFEKLPAQDCIVVANHASYVDGVLLQAILPTRFSYVIKGEAGKAPVLGFFLRRIGAKFVERFSTSGSARDARKLIRAATSGESLAFFPEGTFLVEPGLGKFRAGAFAAAIRAGSPVVPLAISGSRKIMRGGTFLPVRGHINVEMLNPISPSDPAFKNSKLLAERSRQAILKVLPEPDLLARQE